jgi:cob(I)alamin adenosyltransferase
MGMSIATKRGDGGETSLIGGVRVSKAETRVEAYGSVDELISAMGFARSICEDASIAALTLTIQKELFSVGSALATPAGGAKVPEPIEVAMIDRLTVEVHRLEAREGMLSDWSIPGGHTAAAAYDVARTICRRAERAVVRLVQGGDPVQPTVIAYLNRLSDLLWLFGRSLECDAGVDGSLRSETGKRGNRWSRAW